MKQAILILVLNLIGTSFLLSQQKVIDQAFEVGTLPGVFNVNLNGAATYNIPIDLPEGRAGLTPAISLIYNSHGGDGLLGARWSIVGLSTIIRTGTNLYNDGFIDGVDFENDDRFTLDGSRLIPIDEVFF